MQCLDFRFAHPSLIGASLLACAGYAHAQADAGAIQQQLERERQQVQPAAKPAPSIALPKPSPVSPGAETIVVKQWRFEGNATLGTSALQAHLSGYVGQSVSLAQLYEAAQAVVDFYAQRGWLASADLPKQDITEGAITIRIVEAALGQLQIEGTPQRVSREQIQAFAAQNLHPGRHLSLVALERGLILADELPGVNVSGRLMAGERAGTTDVVLTVKDEPAFYGEVSADNYGSRSTGAKRVSGNLMLNSPLGVGDQANLYVQHAEGMRFARISETVPVGTNGWRAGVNASHLSYEVLGLPGLAGAGGKGTSQSVGAELNYPLWRNSTQQANLVLAQDFKNYDNLDPYGAVTTHYTNRVSSLGLNGTVMGAGTFHAYGFTFSSGNVQHDRAREPSAPAIPGEGTFTKLRANYALSQTVSDTLSFYGQVQGQVANKNLDSSERFFLGGPLGVRAYPGSEGGGTQGAMVNLEIRQRLPEGFQVIAFYDHGRVQVEKTSTATTSNTPNTYSLRGSGLGVIWNGPQKMVIKALWSRRLGSNPNPASTGMDQDGTLKMDRFWLSASLSF